MAIITKLRFAMVAAVTTSVLVFSGCGDDDNPEPSTPGAGGKGTGGKTDGTGAKPAGGSGGKVDTEGGVGGTSSGGGGGSDTGGSENTGGADNTGGEPPVIPDAGCDEDGCWKCEAKVKLTHFLNACTDAQCTHYDNSGLPSPLPELP